MKVNQLLNEADEAANSLKAELLKVCEAFYKKRGAKFGKVQTIADFDFKGGHFAGRPAKFTDETTFVTKEVTITGGGGMAGRDVEAALWVVPKKKDGTDAKPIRLTFISIPKY